MPTSPTGSLCPLPQGAPQHGTTGAAHRGSSVTSTEATRRVRPTIIPGALHRTAEDHGLGSGPLMEAAGGLGSTGAPVADDAAGVGTPIADQIAHALATTAAVGLVKPISPLELTPAQAARVLDHHACSKVMDLCLACPGVVHSPCEQQLRAQLIVGGVA